MREPRQPLWTLARYVTPSASSNQASTAADAAIARAWSSSMAATPGGQRPHRCRRHLGYLTLSPPLTLVLHASFYTVSPILTNKTIITIAEESDHRRPRFVRPRILKPAHTRKRTAPDPFGERMPGARNHHFLFLSHLETPRIAGPHRAAWRSPHRTTTEKTGEHRPQRGHRKHHQHHHQTQPPLCSPVLRASQPRPQPPVRSYPTHTRVRDPIPSHCASPLHTLLFPTARYSPAPQRAHRLIHESCT